MPRSWRNGTPPFRSGTPSAAPARRPQGAGRPPAGPRAAAASRDEFGFPPAIIRQDPLRAHPAVAFSVVRTAGISVQIFPTPCYETSRRCRWTPSGGTSPAAPPYLHRISTTLNGIPDPAGDQTAGQPDVWLPSSATRGTPVVGLLVFPEATGLGNPRPHPVHDRRRGRFVPGLAECDPPEGRSVTHIRRPTPALTGWRRGKGTATACCGRPDPLGRLLVVGMYERLEEGLRHCARKWAGAPRTRWNAIT